MTVAYNDKKARCQKIRSLLQQPLLLDDNRPETKLKRSHRIIVYRR